MTERQKLRRIVTCQGGIQLIAAVAALRSHESKHATAGVNYEYEDYLVIYDLYSPAGQLDDFVAVVKKMAAVLDEWRKVVYVTSAQMDDFAVAASSTSPADTFAQVHALVGAATADEIYLCRNWQFGNQLMINAYRDATKICYGDSVGIYFSESYFLPAPVDDPKETKSLREKLGGLRISLREKLSEAKPKTVLKEIDFDIGYFLLPDILGQQPPMSTRRVEKELMLGIFRRLAEALDPDDIRDRYQHIADASNVFLMTSNFSEAARMSVDDERVAYRQFLERQNLPRESILVIKPHPRESEEKIKRLGEHLRDLFSDVVLLTEPNLFSIPFEIFLLQLFPENEAALRRLRIITFSTACLTLEALFALGPVVGFGNDLVTRFFKPNFVTGRIQHEDDLRLALQRLSENG